MVAIFSVEAVVSRSVPLVGWSGSFLAKVIKSWFPREVLECGFSISPLLMGRRIVLSGVNGSSTVLEAGSRVAFRFTSYCRDGSTTSRVVDVLSSGALDVFRVAGVEFQVLESSMDLVRGCSWCGGDRLVKYIDSRGRGVVEVFFGPTMLMFRGWRVLYPSPQRLIYTLARSGVNFFEIDPRVAKKRARTLSRNVEVIGFGTRSVDVSIGRDRVVKAFMGRALFGVQGLENLRDFVELLEVGRAVGAGRSRGIGFGYMEYRVAEPGV
ncbi:MAG: CRISPR system precrRNA processing endoribonuclease RAMP protein Cas6 [Ignisphaera sp.]